MQVFLDTDDDGVWNRAEYDTRYADGRHVTTIQTNVNDSGGYDLQVDRSDNDNNGTWDAIQTYEDSDFNGKWNRLTIQNWYAGSQYHVEQFKTADGHTLLDSQVQNLVNAMAAFSPPAAGETQLPASDAATLNPVIAANWQ